MDNQLIMTGNQSDPVSGTKDGDVIALDVALKNAGANGVPEYDAVQVTSTDSNDNPTEIEYYQGGTGGTVVATFTITYDGSGNFESLTITK